MSHEPVKTTPDAGSSKSRARSGKKFLRLCSGIAVVLGAVKAIQDQWDWWQTHDPMQAVKAAADDIKSHIYILLSELITILDLALCYSTGLYVFVIFGFLEHWILYTSLVVIAVIVVAVFDKSSPDASQPPWALEMIFIILFIVLSAQAAYRVFHNKTLEFIIHPERRPGPPIYRDYMGKWFLRLVGIFIIYDIVTKSIGNNKNGKAV